MSDFISLKREPAEPHDISSLYVLSFVFQDEAAAELI